MDYALRSLRAYMIGHYSSRDGDRSAIGISCICFRDVG